MGGTEEVRKQELEQMRQKISLLELCGSADYPGEEVLAVGGNAG